MPFLSADGGTGRMPKKLINLTIEEVSVVDSPANKYARMLLMKRDVNGDEQGSTSHGGNKMSESDTNSANSANSANASLEARFEELTQEVARLREANAAMKAASEEAARLASFRETLPGEMRAVFDRLDDNDKVAFSKSYSPDKSATDPVVRALESVTADNVSLKKQLDDMTSQIAALNAAREIAGIEQEIADLSVVTDTVDLAKRLHALRKSDQTLAENVLADYRKMAAMQKQAGIFRVIGTNKKESGNNSEFNAAVAEMRASNPTLTHAQVVAKVLANNPRFYDDYEAERKGA